jgi:hypothetical protein
MSKKGSKPDIEPGNVSVCFVPEADIPAYVWYR